MLAKLTSKNQLTLPKSIMSQIPKTEHFDVAVEGDHIVLMPVRVSHMAAIRKKMASLDLTDQDLRLAVQWARRKP